MTALDIAREYIERHNIGVSGSDFSSMLELFHEQAELRFASIPFGPFHGRDAIATAFREHPPSDHLALLDAVATQGGVHITYGWASSPESAGGTIEGEIADGRIRLWTITFA